MEECGGVDLLKEIALSDDRNADHAGALLDELFERNDIGEAPHVDEEDVPDDRW
jgi:hypothetical protein